MNDLSFPVPMWVWAAVTVGICVMLAVDLIAHRDNHVIGFKEAAIWSSVWIAIGLGFGLILLAWQGGEVSSTYYAGYLIEKALSIDNVFVFALVFSFFAVPDAYQHKVLFWGVLGALAARLVFIFVGAELLQVFFWTAYLFGAFLIWTGWKMAVSKDEEVHPDRNPIVRLVKKLITTDAKFHGDKFFIRVNGKRVATLLFVVLVAVEATDLIFAVDSVAAVLAITTNTFLVWTANAFAVLGLRSLYFCLAGLLRRFAYLHYGLAVLLAFAGVKLILSETPVGKLPIPLTLGVITLTITVSIAWSLIATRNQPANGNEQPAGTEAGAAGGDETTPAPATSPHRPHGQKEDGPS
ncbi:TerC family protein [Streptomyces parvus]|uniref:Tellurium resistance protein TerC n=2 Tax=Streptomyces TaxID=1883 RepID=A0A1E7M0P4_9ACTN|nr:MULTISPECIES: TerC family protein [Streptomyces]OEV22014.1 tellurium resistance protein TerC [Streptomyces nanshensis]ONI49838.1 Inner membrane protein alx [Streptomyces sp. IB2014 011-1]RDV48380.1 TerC family protein [Streptomyces sp. IB2014 011-12]